jgi:hypothetical protein
MDERKKAAAVEYFQAWAVFIASCAPAALPDARRDEAMKRMAELAEAFPGVDEAVFSAVEELPINTMAELRWVAKHPEQFFVPTLKAF